MGLFGLFGSGKSNGWKGDPVMVDMHSHILPGIDDGADSIEVSLELISGLQELGYKKLIATPHIMGDFYKNTPEIIHRKLDTLRNELEKRSISIALDAAAEYYLDEAFMDMLDKESRFLTFGKNYLLFETSYINESAFLNEALFKILSLGYKPVLAHPERYTYLYSDFSKYQEIYEKGVLFQLNINSLSGYYNKGAQKIAEKLIENKMIDFIGTDCHGPRHIDALKKSISFKSYTKLSQLNLLNNTLLS